MSPNTENVKVILLAPVPPPAGGIGRWTERFLAKAKKYNIDVELINETPPGLKAQFGTERHISLFEQFKRCFSIWRKLNMLCKKNEYKIVHCCIPSYKLSMLREYISLRIAKHFKKKFIIHFRSTVPNAAKGSFSLFLLKKMLKHSDKVILLNDISLLFCLEKYSKANATVIPNFVETKEIVNEKNISNNIKKVCYVGGVVEDKGVYTILKSATHFPNIMFYLVGAYDRTIKDKADDQNIHNVVFCGELDKGNVTTILDESDVFLFLSKYSGEGFSNALLEAMARGLPCIVTNWAANPDMVGKYKELIVDIDDVAGVLNALEYLDDCCARKEISIYNIDRVSKYYSEYVIMKNYYFVYKEMILEREKNENKCHNQ